MAVIDWDFLATDESEPKITADGERRYRLTIDATSDDPNESGLSILSHSEFPRQFVSRHPNDPFAVALEADPRRHVDLATYWTITYDYSTKVPQLAQLDLATGGGGGEGKPVDEASHDPNDPLSWAPKVKFSTKKFKRIVYRDRDGKSYVNASGELFELQQREYSRLVMHVQRNVPEFDVSLLNAMNGGVNSTGTIGYVARRIMCEKLTADFHVDKDRYWALDGEFIIGADADLLLPGCPADGWFYEKKLNAGYHYWDLLNQKLVPIFHRGQKPTRPVPLNASGGAILNSRDIATGAAQPNYLFFRELADADFNATGLFNP